LGSAGQDGRVVLLEGCEVDVAQCELVRGSVREHLTTKEVEVLSYLSDHPSRTVSYEELLEEVWGHSRLASTQPVYSTIKRLRRKVDGHGAHRHLVTVHGVGYRFEPPPHVRARDDEPERPSVRPSVLRLARFVGRARELAQVEAALAHGARVVSVVGPGGAGKTRLALEVSARAAARGSAFVLCDLSELASGADPVPVIAGALGARATPGDRRGRSGLVHALRARGAAALLVDNAEHVLERVVDVVAELAPITPVLVTSRERLAVPGEHVVELGPLADADGIALLEDRLQLSGAALESTEIARELVARLDGLPLAIELAAAHAGIVSVAHVQAALDRQIDALRSTRRGSPARHATLRASVAWSWSLLDARARAVLSACVVFAGGFTLEAAEAVIGDDAPTELARLRERSLLRTLPGSGARLALYESVRELAAEQLAERDAIEARHAAWARALVEKAGALDAVPPPAAFATLAPELENLRAAFQRVLARDPSTATALALAIDLVEAPTRGAGAAPELEQALAHARTTDAVRLRLARGLAQEHQGEGGLRFLEDTRRLARAEGSALDAIEADRQWASTLVALGSPGAAIDPLEDALARARGLAAPAAIGRVALGLAEASLAAGRLDRAEALGGEAMRALDAAGDPSGAARAATVIAHVQRERGVSEHALAALDRAGRWLEEVGDEVALARLAIDRGALLAHFARTADAVAPLEEAIAAHRRLGLLTGELRARDWMVLVRLGLGEDDEALGEARAMAALALELDRPSYEAERAFGATWLVTGELDDADDALGRALTLLEAGGKAAVRGHVLSVRALVRVLAGRLADAEADLEAAVAIHDARGSDAARKHARAELALVRELIAPREGTARVLDEAEPTGGAPWERRHARGRRAVLAIVRARREGHDAAGLVATARADLLEGAAAPTDYFTRCTLLLVEHVARA
jgi:predicted ATPase/DNA-binding winged helix-turn-helix (wHTH) protein